MKVTTAQRDGSRPPSQDRVLVLPHAVIILDGASSPEPTTLDGGWLAQTLGDELAALLDSSPDADLADLLHDAIGRVAAHHSLVPGRSPSTTVAIARWDDEDLDVLVLSDTVVIAQTTDRQVHEVRDARLSATAGRDAIRAAMSTAGGFGVDQPDRWQELVRVEQAARNTPGGYWIAEAVPEAARHAIRARFPLGSLTAALVATDGVANGVDRYRMPPHWTAALAIARQNVDELVDLVHDTEKRDPDGVRWPRSKRHDDKTAALLIPDGV